MSKNRIIVGVIAVVAALWLFTSGHLPGAGAADSMRSYFGGDGDERGGYRRSGGGRDERDRGCGNGGYCKPIHVSEAYQGTMWGRNPYEERGR